MTQATASPAPGPPGTGLDPILEAARVVPVLSVSDPDQARPLGAALVAGGATAAEVTLRTPAALEVIATLAAEADLVVGVGTVLTVDDVDAAVAAGARFVVTPGFSRRVVAHCTERGIPVVPGVATPTEMLMARECGMQTVKLFPAGALGGPSTVRALAAPFGDLRFMPTGGIRQQDLAAYWAEPSVIAVGGTWVAPPNVVAAADWAEVTDRMAAALACTPPRDGLPGERR